MTNKGNSSPFAIPIPFGGGSNKSLITVTTRENRGFLNTFGISRFNILDATDLIIILSIATFQDGKIDEGTIDMVESMFAGSFSEDGLARAEFLMQLTNILATGTLPHFNNNGNNRNGDAPGIRDRLFRHNRRDKEEESRHGDDRY